MEVSSKQGTFSWIELLTRDVTAAKSFYSELFGWEAEDSSYDGGSYTVFKMNGEQVAGMMAMPEQAQGAPPHWGSYVTVDDVDATAKKAQEMGGTILVPPMDVASVGRFCTIQDPQGAVISIIKYA